MVLTSEGSRERREVYGALSPGGRLALSPCLTLSDTFQSVSPFTLACISPDEQEVKWTPVKVVLRFLRAAYPRSEEVV